MFFVGEYQVNFSGQGRIIIPKKIREALGTGKTFTLTKGFTSCLSGFRNDDWKKAANELIGQSTLDNRKEETKRHLFSSSAIMEIDNQRRFVIPKPLLDYAELRNRATIIGVGDHFEIWEPQKWQGYLQKIEKNESLKSL